MVPQGLKPIYISTTYVRAEQAAEKLGTERKDVPQGLKPDVFSIIYGTTKVVP